MASGLHFLGRAWEKRRCGGKFPVYIPEDRRYHKRRDGLGRMPGDGGIRVRLFIGILLPRAVRDSVAESARLLEQHCAAGRFVPRENYHLTLAFLGEQPEGALETICLLYTSPSPRDRG